MDELVVVLRMLERITAVLIGGVSIYLGYRLFFHLPYIHDNEGQLELPGVKIVLSRVGPGIFFAAFGSLVLYYSLTTPVSVTSQGAPNSLGDTNSDANRNYFIGVSGGASSDLGVSLQQRSKILTSIEILNCAQRLIANQDSTSAMQDQFSLAFGDAKRELMLSIWNDADWGPPDQLGVPGFIDNAPIQIRSMFTATYEGCPE